MHKTLATFLCCALLVPSYSQTKHGLPLYLEGQYNGTLYDRTFGNNPWAMGMGLQCLWKNHALFTPAAEISADIYLEDDKVFRTNPDGSEIRAVYGMLTAFGGGSFHPLKFFYLSFLAGPALLSNEIRFGIKPSLGFYFSKTQKCTGKISFIQVYNRDVTTKEDFGSISFALGIRL